MDFGRLVTAMVTPFDSDLQVDYAKTEELVDRLIRHQHTDSIVVCGTTGESPTLTDEEKVKLFEIAVKAAGGRCKIIAGTGSNNTAHSIELTQLAQKAGVDGVLLVAPYYNRPNQEGLYQHFKTIAESTDLPVMLYNIPKRTGVTLSTDLIVRLSNIDNIVATKESTGDLEQIAQIAAQTSDSFKVYSGDDSLTLPVLSVGGYGIVSVASHIIGKEIKQMVEHFVSGKVQEAASLNAQLLNIFTGLFICPNPVPVKYALELQGFQAGGVRLPLVWPNETEQAAIRKLFSK
ncbi:4-hydroxy-tetrahydrodipicolinate synthase [Marinicrinis lubricantis]|uniref:4-hydroxy-tetrahydrodipicolinate synthase n=1 Tax=Marinicrinis lubricantis TaxID=2086470 RepID=A0ABW1IM88_9BACL